MKQAEILISVDEPQLEEAGNYIEETMMPDEVKKQAVWHCGLQVKRDGNNEKHTLMFQ